MTSEPIDWPKPDEDLEIGKLSNTNSGAMFKRTYIKKITDFIRSNKTMSMF